MTETFLPPIERENYGTGHGRVLPRVDGIQILRVQLRVEDQGAVEEIEA